MRSFIQKGGQLHEEAEMRHNTSRYVVQRTKLHCEGRGGEVQGGSDENSGLRGHRTHFYFLSRLDYSVCFSNFTVLQQHH